MELLIRMSMPKETCLDVWTAIQTQEELLLFLDTLSDRNYEMTPEDVYRASVEAVLEYESKGNK